MTGRFALRIPSRGTIPENIAMDGKLYVTSVKSSSMKNLKRTAVRRIILYNFVSVLTPGECGAAYRKPSAKIPTRINFLASGTCKRNKIGIGKMITTTSNTTSTDRESIYFRFLSAQWPGRSGYQFFFIGEQKNTKAKKVPIQ
jgi:hypothetical protein